MEKPGGGEEPRGRCTATTPASPAPSLRKLSKHPAAFVDTTTELVYLLLRYLLIRSLSLSPLLCVSFPNPILPLRFPPAASLSACLSFSSSWSPLPSHSNFGRSKVKHSG